MHSWKRAWNRQWQCVQERRLLLLLRLDDLLHDFGLLNQERAQYAGMVINENKTDQDQKVLAHRCLTHSPQRDPPYALRTVFWRLEMVAYSRGRRAGI